MKIADTTFTITSILHDADDEADRKTLPMPSPEEDDTMPTFNFPEIS
jgi:hypothetical protein